MDYATQFLGRTVKVVVERKLGGRHETHGFFYPINYGFIDGVKAPDGDDVDAYVLGVFEPIDEFTGQCIAVIHRIDDEDDKLIVAPEGREYTDDQIRALTEFQERFFTSEILRP